MLISLIDSIHMCKEIRILPSFTHKSFTTIFDSVICNCNSWLIHMLTVCYLSVFHCIFGHASYTGGDKTQVKPIPGRHQPLCIPVLQNPRGWDQSWGSMCQGMAALSWSPALPCYCLRSPASISFLQAPGCLRYIPCEFHVLFEKITQNQWGRQARKTSVAK